MTAKTLAILVRIASSRVLGEDGNTAFFHASQALASIILDPEDFPYFHLGQMRKAFRHARLSNRITPHPPRHHD